jgi:hypothetical protein
LRSVSLHVRRGEVAKKWVMCLQYQRCSEGVGEKGEGFGMIEMWAMCIYTLIIINPSLVGNSTFKSRGVEIEETFVHLC